MLQGRTYKPSLAAKLETTPLKGQAKYRARLVVPNRISKKPYRLLKKPPAPTSVQKGYRERKLQHHGLRKRESHNTLTTISYDRIYL